MGSFQGHVLPGVFFLLVGLRTTYKQLEKYFLARRATILGQRKGLAFRTSLTHGFDCCRNVPVEEMGLIFMAVFGIIGNFIERELQDHDFTKVYCEPVISYLGNGEM